MMRFQSAAPWSCHQIAASVSSAVRVVLVSEPTLFTSLKSVAYSALVTGFGPSLRNWDGLSMRNGRTSPTHGAGSTAKVGAARRHSPGPDPKTNVNGPPRPWWGRGAPLGAGCPPPPAPPPALAPGGPPGGART